MIALGERRCMYRIVTLFGKVIEPEKWLPFYVLDVLPDLGDAKEFALAGQVKIHRRQVYEFHSDPGTNGKDIVRLREHIARSLGKPPDAPPPPDKPPRKRKSRL